MSLFSARRNTKLLVEPPAVATGDIAFNLVVFFLVCASVQPDGGRPQEIPKAERQNETKQMENLEVQLTRGGIKINGQSVLVGEFVPRLRTLLASKTGPESRVVVVKSTRDTPYHFWIQVTGLVEEAGGVVTLQMEEQQTIITN